METRQNEGAREYGELAFLGNDMVQFIQEELVDMANYARFLFMKLTILKEQALEGGIDITSSVVEGVQQSDELPAAPSPFIASSEVFGLLQEK